jgi:hypothetical protein
MAGIEDKEYKLHCWWDVVVKGTVTSDFEAYFFTCMDAPRPEYDRF